MPHNPGTVFWFTGVSGVGKTTLGSLFADALRQQGKAVVFLDGDEMREAFGNDLGHDRASRLRSAMRNARFCALLSKQGVDVVCATISLFHEVHEWNRKNITAYKEIYIDTPMETLRERDPKQIYQAGKDIVGIDVAPEIPKNPDLTIENAAARKPAEWVQEILGFFQLLTTKVEPHATR